MTTEKWKGNSEYLSNDDLDYILGVALTQPKVISLMQKYSMLNKEKE